MDTWRSLRSFSQRSVLGIISNLANISSSNATMKMTLFPVPLEVGMVMGQTASVGSSSLAWFQMVRVSLQKLRGIKTELLVNPR